MLFKIKSAKKYIFEIFYLLGEDKKRLPSILMLFFMVSMLDVAGVGLIGPYISIVANPEIAIQALSDFHYLADIPRNQEDLLVLMSVLLVIVFVIKAVAAVWINYIIVRFSMDQQVRLRSKLMRAYQLIPYADYLKRNSSEYIYSMQTLTERYSSSVILSSMKAASDSIVAIGILSLLAWASLESFLLLVILLVTVVFVYDKSFRKKIHLLGVKTNNVSASMICGINESIEGFKEIKILGHEKYFYNKVNENSEKYADYSANLNLISTAPRYLLEFIMIFFIVMLVVLAVSLEHDLSALLPILGMFGLAAIRLLPSVNVFSNNLMQLRFSRDSVSKLYQDVIYIEDELFVEIPNDECVGGDEFKEMLIKDICFHYPGMKINAINNFSIKIKSGESIGLIGDSGAGKTTLVDILLGLLVPQCGDIYYNGRSIRENPNHWHRHVAYLPQNIFLIDASIKDNVALGVENKDIEIDKINDALKKARLMKLIEQLPEGIDTVIGERGVRFSGGQRQRIALARAFYNNRDVLILDESTSALDHGVEQEIVDEIRQLKGNKTVIIIAHRLTTVAHCNYIYRLKEGRIIESGAPSEILTGVEP